MLDTFQVLGCCFLSQEDVHLKNEVMEERLRVRQELYKILDMQTHIKALRQTMLALAGFHQYIFHKVTLL